VDSKESVNSNTTFSKTEFQRPNEQQTHISVGLRYIFGSDLTHLKFLPKCKYNFINSPNSTLLLKLIYIYIYIYYI